MSQQMKVTLVGAKSTDWKSEDGRHYDHVTLFALIPMDTSGGNLVQLQGRKFPFEATLELDLVSTGRSTKQVLTNVILPPKA